MTRAEPTEYDHAHRAGFFKDQSIGIFAELFLKAAGGRRASEGWIIRVFRRCRGNYLK
jgi:hypothetical protein